VTEPRDVTPQPRRGYIRRIPIDPLDLAAVAAGLVITLGVFIQFGPGAALIVAGSLLLSFALLLARANPEVPQ